MDSLVVTAQQAVDEARQRYKMAQKELFEADAALRAAQARLGDARTVARAGGG